MLSEQLYQRHFEKHLINTKYINEAYVDKVLLIKALSLARVHNKELPDFHYTNAADKAYGVAVISGAAMLPHLHYCDVIMGTMASLITNLTGMSGTLSPPPTSKQTASWRSRHASRHVRHARAVMHVGIANPRWRGKRSQHSRRMHNPQFYVSDKRPMRIPMTTITRSWDRLIIIMGPSTDKTAYLYWDGPQVRALSYLRTGRF